MSRTHPSNAELLCGNAFSFCSPSGRLRGCTPQKSDFRCRSRRPAFVSSKASFRHLLDAAQTLERRKVVCLSPERQPPNIRQFITRENALGITSARIIPSLFFTPLLRAVWVPVANVFDLGADIGAMGSATELVVAGECRPVHCDLRHRITSRCVVGSLFDLCEIPKMAHDFSFCICGRRFFCSHLMAGRASCHGCCRMVNYPEST